MFRQIISFCRRLWFSFSAKIFCIVRRKNKSANSVFRISFILSSSSVANCSLETFSFSLRRYSKWLPHTMFRCRRSFSVIPFIWLRSFASLCFAMTSSALVFVIPHQSHLGVFVYFHSFFHFLSARNAVICGHKKSTQVSLPSASSPTL